MASENFREFPREGVLASVVFNLDHSRHTSPEIDQKTGEISLRSFTYGGLNTMADARAKKGKLVTSFQLEVATANDDRDVFVTAREDGSNYLRPAAVAPFGQLTKYTLPPCTVRMRERKPSEMESLGLPKLAVWCHTNQKPGASNRADIWSVGKGTSDRVADLGLFAITIDDGQNFRLIGEYRWEGAVYKRSKPAPYELKSDDQRVAVVLGSDEVRQFLHDYVMVPDEGYGNFELKFQALLIPGFIARLKTAADRVWEGSEDFWLKPEPKVVVSEGQGVVEFHLYGMAEGSFGIVDLPKSVEVGGRMCDKAQIRHNFVEAEEDEQGLKIIKPGDIIEYGSLVSMDNGGNEYPPMLKGARVVYQYRDAA